MLRPRCSRIELAEARLAVVERRLEPVRRILAVTGGKGGVGKSSLSVGLALLLTDRGRRVGLLDVDFNGPSAHVLLGADREQPREDRGLIPPWVQGIQFLSLVHFAGDSPVAFRGEDWSTALLELLTVARWAELDWLIVDMPPGTGEPVLDVVRLMSRAEFLVVTTPSAVALATVRKLMRLLGDLHRPGMGVIENMRRPEGPSAAQALTGFGVPYLGSIDYDEGFEEAVGDPCRLRQTRFFRGLQELVGRTPTLTAGAPRRRPGE